MGNQNNNSAGSENQSSNYGLIKLELKDGELVIHVEGNSGVLTTMIVRALRSSQDFENLIEAGLLMANMDLIHEMANESKNAGKSPVN